MAFERIELDVNANGEMKTFHAKQFDVGRPIILDLVKGKDAYTPASGVIFELHCRKVDDNIVIISTYELDGNTLTFASTEQLTACVGKNLATVKMFLDDMEIGTMNFFLDVTIDPDFQGLTSETQIETLYEQVEEITEQVIGDNYYDKTEVDNLLDTKADAAQVYTMSQTDLLLADKADKSTTYTKTQVDDALALKANSADLATVATTGDYDDLLNKPTIPAAQVQSDYAQLDNTQVDYIKNKPDIEGMINNALLEVMPVDTASGSIASFNTTLAAPLVNVSSNVVATGGNGTPDNPNPINGYSSANITRCGVNLLKNTATTRTIDGVTFTVNDDGTVTANGTATATTDFIIISSSAIIALLEQGQSYVFSGCPSGGSQSTYSMRLNIIGKYDTGAGITVNNYDNTELGNFSIRINSGYQCNNLVFKPMICLSSAASPTVYHPYNGQTYAIAFGQTVYGGVLDVTRGKLKPCVEYPSYNGETLSGRWLSSEATYIEGTTPPTGSQVVSLDDYGSDIDLTPVQISALVGENNVFSGTNGNTTVKFKDSIQHYIDTKVGS